MEAGQWVRRLVGKREGEEHPRDRRLLQRIEWVYGWGINLTLKGNKGQKNAESTFTDQKQAGVQCHKLKCQKKRCPGIQETQKAQ